MSECVFDCVFDDCALGVNACVKKGLIVRPFVKKNVLIVFLSEKWTATAIGHKRWPTVANNTTTLQMMIKMASRRPTPPTPPPVLVIHSHRHHNRHLNHSPDPTKIRSKPFSSAQVFNQ